MTNAEIEKYSMTDAEIAEYLRKHRNEFPQFTDAEIKIALKHLEEEEKNNGGNY